MTWHYDKQVTIVYRNVPPQFAAAPRFYCHTKSACPNKRCLIRAWINEILAGWLRLLRSCALRKLRV